VKRAEAGGQPVVAITTVAPPEQAQRLATQLVERRLAACVQQLPIQSVYRWQGAVQQEPETLLLIKTRDDLVGEIEKLFGELHPYDLPELVALPIVEGSEGYLGWLRDNLPPWG
jgi:periplasmic divalent cation tolerance protein